MANVSKFKMALTGAAVAGMLFVTVAPSQGAGLFAQRFSALKNESSASSSTAVGGWKWSLIQYRAQKYDQVLSRYFGRPVSPFCRFFC